jgi:DHA1 family bicyclomycin/chloramphenicol resistance-like MFS transporter
VLGFSELGFGIMYSMNALGMVGLTYLSAILAMRGVHPAKTLGVGVAVLVMSAVAVFLVPASVLPVVLFVVSANHGLITGNASALALSEVRHIAGSGSASLGGVQFVSGGIGSSVVGAEGADSATPYFVVLASAAFTGVAAYLVGISRRGEARMD